MKETQEELDEIRETSGKEVQDILRELESSVPDITEGLGAITGAGIGGAGSFVALSALGTTGLSAAGITSGLATAGSIVGGGMVAGIGVLAAPVAILAIAGYAIFKDQKIKTKTAALQHALAKLYNVMTILQENAENFKEEISGIKGIINLLKERSA
ncbi:MAG: hypothetical protein KAH77_06685 [Thiomargarita sp.]|nr:hypothetical protein [Thiomargarita sp.]